jgi:ribosome-binding factor A
MPKSYWLDRVNETIREALGELIEKRLKDPRIGFVTVTEVRTSPDLSVAKVYVSVLGDESARKASLAGLESARGFLRRSIAKVLDARHVPELRFVLDDSLDRAMAIEETLKEIHRQEETTREGEEDASPESPTEEEQ